MKVWQITKLKTIGAICLVVFSLTACTKPETKLKASGAQNSDTWLNAPTVIMISIDGLRHDYIKRDKPPTLSKLASEGVAAKGLVPIFPSKTFPNHYAIASGVRAEKHGIVGNEFYEPSSGRSYAMKDRKEVEDGYWYQAPPVWNLLKDAGMVTASYFWVGSEAPINGKQPDFWYSYDGSVPGETRIKQALDWLIMPPALRPHFITLYFSDVDNAGHEYGPDSKEVTAALHDVDRHLTKLLHGLAKLTFPVHLVITSDHGMARLSDKKLLFIDDHVKDFTPLKIVGKGPNTSLFFVQDKKQLSTIKKQLAREKHWKVYERHELPSQWGINHERIGDLLLVAKPGYYIYEKRTMFKAPLGGGSHGWDPDEMREMDGVFIAWGEKIKPASLGRISNIHVAPFILGAFGLPIPAHMDGRWSDLGKLIWTP